MKNIFNLLVFITFTNLCFAQDNKKLDSLINVLDNYMSTHIPDMNFGISKFKHIVEHKTLTKTTFVYEGDPHDKMFNLENAVVEIEKLMVDREAARAYGFKYYYEISIDGSWFSSNIEDVIIAKRIKIILDEIIREVN